MKEDEDDDLDQLIREETEKNPDFPRLVEEALKRRQDARRAQEPRAE